MLYEILNYLNNWFVDTQEISTEFEIVADGITGTFNEQYVVGQYISLDGTKLNDGVYKVTGFTSSKITVQETLIAESPTDVNIFIIWGLAIPPTVINLSTEISTYVSRSAEGLTSELQGNRSVSYKNGSSWTDVYKSRLIPFKRMFSDKSVKVNYNWQNRRCY